MSRLNRWIEGTFGGIQDRIAGTRRPERILVIHIAKTAGTSLRRMLQDEYGPRLVYPGDFHLRHLTTAGIRWAVRCCGITGKYRLITF